jgi:hypothetical protein
METVVRLSYNQSHEIGPAPRPTRARRTCARAAADQAWRAGSRRLFALPCLFGVSPASRLPPHVPPTRPPPAPRPERAAASRAMPALPPRDPAPPTRARAPQLLPRVLQLAARVRHAARRGLRGVFDAPTARAAAAHAPGAAAAPAPAAAQEPAGTTLSRGPAARSVPLSGPCGAIPLALPQPPRCLLPLLLFAGGRLQRLPDGRR